MSDRYEIFDQDKTGVMPMRKKFREFQNHSSMGFNILTNEPQKSSPVIHTISHHPYNDNADYE